MMQQARRLRMLKVVFHVLAHYVRIERNPNNTAVYPVKFLYEGVATTGEVTRIPP
jgi:hypothetical protein